VNPHRHNTTLHTLVLNDNRIGDVGAAAIGEGLRCVSIQSFVGLVVGVTCSGFGALRIAAP
jgi:hypothetical protein